MKPPLSLGFDTIIDSAEKTRRKVEKRRASGVAERAKYDTERARQTEQRKTKVLALKADGLSTRAIAEVLGVSAMQISRDLKGV